MAEIRPFRGVRYNQRWVKDLSVVICSPSDELTPEWQKELYCRGEYNFVRLDACMDTTEGLDENAKWHRAAVTMKNWLAEGILQVDAVPAIYLHDYYFNYSGREYMRRGIIAIVRLEEWDSMIIRRHEKVLPELTNSKLIQFRALRANTSPIMAFFKGDAGRVAKILSSLSLNEPVISFSSDIDGRHNVWAITDPGVIGQISDSLASEPIYLADGHHRYEGALAYRNEGRTSHSAGLNDDAGNYVMVSLSSISDPGMIVRQFHRLIRGVPDSILSGLLSGLNGFFDVEEWSLEASDIWQRVDDLLDARDPEEPDEVAMVLFSLAGDKLVILRVRDFDAISKAMPPSQSELSKRLDVSIADQIIIEKLLQITGKDKEKLLSFSNDRPDAVRRVMSGEFQLALLLRAPRIEQIVEMSDAGITMPPKSDRFYRKSPTGLVFYQME